MKVYLKKLLSAGLALILMLSCFNSVIGINVTAEVSSAVTESSREAIKALSLAAAGVSSAEELTVDEGYSISRGDSPWYIATRNQNIASGWADAYYFCPTQTDYFKYTASWEYENASSINIVNIGTENERFRAFPHIDSNTSSMNERRNHALKLYYIAEANGEYYLSDENVGDFTVISGAAEGWRAYASIYVNGIEKFRSSALTEAGQTAGFGGLTVELAAGDKVEYIFDYEFDDTYSGQIYIDFDPRITLLRECEAPQKPEGLGSIADAYGEVAAEWSLPPANNRTTAVTQSQPWKAQYAAYGSDSWITIPYQYRTTNIGTDNAYAYYVFAKNDWSYSRESYVGGTTWKATANTSRAIVMYTSKYSTATPGRRVRVAYTASRDGNYSLGFDKNALRIRSVSSLNCNVYFAVTVNGNKVYNIPLTSVETVDGVSTVTATAGSCFKLPEYISLELKSGDVVGIEMYCEAVEDIAAADDITTKFQIEFIPVFNFETDYETVITSSPAQQLANQAMALEPAGKTTTAITQQGPWYVSLSQEAHGGYWRDAYNIYYTSNYVRYLANWEGDKAACMYVYNCVSGDPYLRTYSRTDQAKENANSGYNSKHRLYYIAETSGTFYFTDSTGGFTVAAGGTGHTAYVTVYVNGIEVYKSTALSATGDFSVFNGFYAKLAEGDIVEYVFDYVYTDTYSGNIRIDFDPQVALLHEEDYKNTVQGLGYVEEGVHSEINSLGTSTSLNAGGITQAGPWYAQQDLGADSDWENMDAYYKAASSLGSNWQIWGYGYKPEGAVTDYAISDAAQLVGYGNWVSTENLGNRGLFMALNFDVAKTEAVRMAYNAEKSGTYTLRFNGGSIPAITNINKIAFNDLANAKAYLTVTLNGETLITSDYLEPVAYSNGPGYQTIEEYTTLELNENDVLAIELHYDIDEGKTIDDVTGKTSVYFDPYLYYQTDFETDYDPNDGIVASIGTELYASLEEAIAAAQDGDIVVLKQDVTVSEPIVTEKAVTLNLGDYTITSEVAADSLIKAYSDLTVNGGKISGNGEAAAVLSTHGAVSIIMRNTVIDFDTADGAVFNAEADGASLSLNNLTVDTNNAVISSAESQDGANYYYETVSAQSGSYTTLGTGFELNIGDTALLDRVTVNAANGSAVTASAAADGAIATYIDCSFTVSESQEGSAVAANGGIAVNVQNGNYSSTANSVYVTADGKINIFGGSFTGALQASGGEIEITSGTFDTDVSGYVVYSSTQESSDNLYHVYDASVDTDDANHYRMDTVLDKIPATIETSVYLSPTVTAAAGTILSNYSSAVAGAYRFYIEAGGKPGMLLVTDSGATVAHTFNADIRTGGWVHIAVVLDAENNTFGLYLDGELKETASVSEFELFAPCAALCVGNNNTDVAGSFFGGRIRSLTMYSDIRSAEEIAADMKAVSADADALIADYSFVNGYDRHIEDNSSNGYSLKNLGFFKQAEPLSDYAYSFAVIGDTQIVAEYSPDKFPMIYDWILDNREERNIQFMIGLGDITNSSTDAEYMLASENFSKLSGIIPYSIIRGNHDKEEGYNKYFGLNSAFACEVDGYYGDNLQNTYKVFTVGQMDYLIVTLDYMPTDEEIAWADAIIAAHPNHNVIITTHWSLNTDRSVSNGIWENLASKHENVVMVLSGHNSYSGILVKESIGENGNTVTQMLIDPQGLDANENVGATGMIAMFYFSEDGKNLQVRFYSPIQDKFYDYDAQFSLTLDTVEYRYGDVNDDAQIDLIDLIRLKKALANADVDYNKRTADCNVDNTVDIYDLVDLRKILLLAK